MPRKTKAEQAQPLRKNQYPCPSVYGDRKAHGSNEEHASVYVAVERWIARRDCDGTCDGHCDRLRRLTRLRTMYARRQQ